MPNWCSNTVLLTHSDSAMISRAEKAIDSQNLLEEFVPIGEWVYETAVEKWGTKWDIAYADIIDRDENTISVSFSTAWSPPVNFYDQLVEQGFQVHAEYFEPGVGFVGTYIDGEDEYYEIDPEDFSNIPADLLESWEIEGWYNDE